jgi:drug/metabolite transporter (DMT)-like permease
MNIEAWALLAAILVLDTGSHLCLKAASNRAEQRGWSTHLGALLAEPVLWLAVVMFIVLFIAWIGFLSHVPLSQGVLAGSITIVGVMIGGRIFFNETLTAARTIAISLVSIGVALVGLGG